MNMNMVMVGRQLEKFKREKKEILKKLQAMKKAANLTSTATAATTPTTTLSPTSTPSPLENEDWMNGVRQELSNMLEGIPVENEKKKTNIENGGTALGSLWDFWRALDTMLIHGKRKRKRRRSLDQCFHATDVTLLGLSYVDFWLTVSSMEAVCVPHEFCQMASEMGRSHHSPIIRQIDATLLYGAAFYLEQMNEKRYSSNKLMQATEKGREHGTCELYNLAKCSL